MPEAMHVQRSPEARHHPGVLSDQRTIRTLPNHPSKLFFEAPDLFWNEIDNGNCASVSVFGQSIRICGRTASR